MLLQVCLLLTRWSLYKLNQNAMANLILCYSGRVQCSCVHMFIEARHAVIMIYLIYLIAEPRISRAGNMWNTPKHQYCNDKYSGTIARPSSVTVLSRLYVYLHMESSVLIFCPVHAVTITNDISDRWCTKALGLWGWESQLMKCYFDQSNHCIFDI